MNETYRHDDKIPFGTYVMYRQLAQLFPSHNIRHNDMSFEDSRRYMSDYNSLYICITRNLHLTYEDRNAMIKYISAGNDLFIAASNFDQYLLDKLGCKLSYEDNYNFFLEKPLRNTYVNNTQPVSYIHNNYGYFYFPFRNYFYDISNHNVKILSVNEIGKPNCIVFFYGKGRLFLHCDPRAFSNYFLLKKRNYQYFTNIINYTRSNPDYIYWDDYYNSYNSNRRGNQDNKGFSALNTIFKHPPLKLAFWLTLLLLLLYVLFQGKRRQRIVETIKPNENTSVTFTETIGRLYLQKKDNYNIAQKMITYFNEYIRNRYFLNTSQANSEFINNLSKKSGVTKDKIESLYRSIQRLQQSMQIQDLELLALNENMQYFFKNCTY